MVRAPYFFTSPILPLPPLLSLLFLAAPFTHFSLSVAPQSPAIKSEKDFVQATSRVATFKALSTLTPAEIRYTPNKLDLVRRVLSTSDDAYRHSEIILDLTEKLGYTDASARAEVLAMLVDAAVAAEDWDLAREHVEAMVEMAEPDLGEPTRGGAEGTSVDPIVVEDEEEADEWGWDEGLDLPEGSVGSPRLRARSVRSTRGPGSVASVSSSRSSAESKVRGMAFRSCLALGRAESYPDLGGRLALLAQSIALAPSDEVSNILPLYHSVEAMVASNPSALKRTTSRPSSSSSGAWGAPPAMPGAGGEGTVLGSRRAAKAAKMAFDLGASLVPLRGSPVHGGARSASPGGSAQAQAQLQGRRSASLTRSTTRSSIDRPRSSAELEREAAALFDYPDTGVRTGARRALVKGVGWLLGADEGDDVL